jgi:uncharacterized protein YjbJ (UPF0337 family)
VSLRQVTFADATASRLFHRLKMFGLTEHRMDIGEAGALIQEVAGKISGAVGDSAAQLAGKVRQLSGKAQLPRADAASAVRKTMATNPFTTLATIAAMSFVAGA